MNATARISIHVLREEDDGGQLMQYIQDKDFNPRPPRGGRPQIKWWKFVCFIFQSTSSARRTTTRHSFSVKFVLHFNPRPPRGGRLPQYCAPRCFHMISIHVLREEDDEGRRVDGIIDIISIHVLREEDDYRRKPRDCAVYISIHVLREEDDVFFPCFCLYRKYFNPRPPRGGRPLTRLRAQKPVVFQSTSSARRTTQPPH